MRAHHRLRPGNSVLASGDTQFPITNGQHEVIARLDSEFPAERRRDHESAVLSKIYHNFFHMADSI